MTEKNEIVLMNFTGVYKEQEFYREEKISWVDVQGLSGCSCYCDGEAQEILEKKIAEKEKELEALRELRFDPEYYHDYQKMRDLDDKIDDVHNEIENFMKKWEDYSEKLEQ